jgi:hypothetical protein
MPGRVPRLSRVPSRRLPPWPRLRRSRRAELDPLHLAARVDPASPGTSSLAGCPSPDVTVNVYSRRSGDLLRPTVATPSVSLRPRGFSPPRRLLPFTAPGMLQPVPGLGSPGFSRVGRRSTSASRIGTGIPSGAPPCEGLLLVGSRTASLRPAPLLPFVAETTSRSPGFAPTSSREEAWVERLVSVRADTVVSDVIAAKPKPSFRPPLGEQRSAPMRRPSARGWVAPPARAACVRNVSGRRSPGSGSTRRALTSR